MLTRIICSLLGSFCSVVIFFVSDAICHSTEQHIIDAFIDLWHAWLKNACADTGHLVYTYFN